MFSNSFLVLTKNINAFLPCKMVATDLNAGLKNLSGMFDGMRAQRLYLIESSLAEVVPA